VRLEEHNARELFQGHDFIVDGSDNFATKFLINDTAVRLAIPYSHAGIVRMQGQTMTVVPRKSACYRCVFKAPPPPEEILSCQQAGILGAVAGTIGSLQATEAVKYLTGFEEGLLVDRLLTYDARSMTFHTVPVKRDPLCPACGTVGSRPAAVAETA
jgi:molybdopterin/thiamine biosynthesis adenylyltransferase